MTNEDKALQEVRKKIDDIDYQIHDLINIRAQQALKVADIKMKTSTELNDFHRPKREAEILARISAYNNGPLSDMAIATIFKSIMKECLQLQQEKLKC